MSDELPKTAAWKDVARGLGPTWASGTYELFSLADAAIEELIKLFSLADAAIEELITKLTASRLAEEFTQERAEEAEARVGELEATIERILTADDDGVFQTRTVRGWLMTKTHPDAEEGA